MQNFVTVFRPYFYLINALKFFLLFTDFDSEMLTKVGHNFNFDPIFLNREEKS
jgi:hypothetical protein